jgi:hypothetical protein
MNNKEMLISIFKKEIGTLRSEHERDYGDCLIHGLEFLHKSKITVKILLIEMEDNRGHLTLRKCCRISSGSDCY